MKSKTPKNAKTKKTARTPRAPKVIPTVTLDGARVVVAGCRWTPPKLTFEKMLQAGATSIGEATKDTAGVIAFPNDKKARAAFEGAFSEPNNWGVETLPDETQWHDSVGMGKLAEQIVNGKGE